MLIVFDTNVIISALLFDGLPEKLVRRVLGGSDQLVSSPYIIGETSRILQTKFKIDPNTLQLLEQLLAESEVVYFEPFLDVLADKPDNRVLETAVKSKANYIVTEDKPLLALKEYKAIQIIGIRDCLEMLL